MEFLGVAVYFLITYLVSDKIGRHKKIGFAKTFILCVIFTPFIGYLIAEGSALKHPRGCAWCGNTENEAEYCGLCGKNENGDLKPNFKK